MKSEVFLTICIIFVNIVAMAPIDTEDEAPDTVILNRIPQEDINRDKRSKFVYMPPCAAASPPAPNYAPDNYHYNIPHQPYQASYAMPQNYAYPTPHYRSDLMEVEPEMLRFSDMDDMPEQLPLPRYVAYAPGSPHVEIHPPIIAQTPHVSGCNIPLIFSCTPSVVSAKLAPQQTYYTSPVSNSYRGVNDQFPLESEEIHQEAPIITKLTKIPESSNIKKSPM